MSRLGYAIAVLLVAVGTGAPSPAAFAQTKKPEILEGIARVIDAGTIDVDGKIVRLFGIVAPGPRQKCLKGNLPWLCGAAARSHLVTLAEGKKVRCEQIQNYIARCTAGPIDLAERMVAAGWAVPDEAGQIYQPAETEARKERRGLWESAPQ